ncbi:class I SAM-dependent methyltransferase [Streptomyces avidinii]|uniref:SAM-dependent methyltransferase n=1 Tax=Streptomyces avidinii TaxID=1895 RepID=A0ABS4L566_STRAV|nr:methyltransferase domain-containing protein [Streptomyces avidinii]MBP2037232.1 SAM-dependent methyltransferase [Streptomyces avidinii]GGY96185.1 methyltransferase type 11 [Streptomyces avidinii]
MTAQLTEPARTASGRTASGRTESGRTQSGGTEPAATESVLTWQADPYADALRSGRGPLYLRRSDGWLLPLDVERWCAEPDEADEGVLARCRGPVLDIGCGPGRLVATLAARGHRALGVDVTPEAVARTTQAGGSALCRSVFDPLPGEGRWGTVLLIDGNIGIGGDPAALLRRSARLAAPGGSLLVEVATADMDERVDVHVDDGRGGHGAPFRWARLGARALCAAAPDAGWTRSVPWQAAGRAFVALQR